MNRRQFLHKLVPIAGATAGACLLPDRSEKAKPTELAAGQIWRDQWGDLRIVLVRDPRLPTDCWETYSFPRGLFAWVPDYSWQDWSYVGTLAELTGGRRR